MFGNLFLSSGFLVDNFMLLYLKKYDKRLTEEERAARNRYGNVIVGSSVVGNLGAIYFLASQVSVFQGLPFNLIRDAKVLLATFGLMYVSHSIAISLLWPRIEPLYEKLNHNEDEQVDFYADNTMNPLKIFYFKNLL